MNSRFRLDMHLSDVIDPRTSNTKLLFAMIKSLLPVVFRYLDLDTIFGLIGQLRLIGPIIWLGAVVAVVQQDLPWKNHLLIASAILPFLLLLLSQLNFVRSVFWSANVSHHWLQPWFMEALDYIMKNSEEGNPSSIVKAMDHFCWTKGPMMNVGDVKGAIIDRVLLDCRPKVALELGTHMGYSAVRFGALVPAGSQYHAVDPDPMGQAMTAKLLAHADLINRVRLWYGYSTDVLQQLAQDRVQLDFLLLDHVKHLYLPDLKLAVSLGLLKKGSVVVADNILFPGSPQYRRWMLDNPDFETTVHKTTAEYTPWMPDEVLVSVYRGSAGKSPRHSPTKRK